MGEVVLDQGLFYYLDELLLFVEVEAVLGCEVGYYGGCVLLWKYLEWYDLFLGAADIDVHDENCLLVFFLGGWRPKIWRYHVLV